MGVTSDDGSTQTINTKNILIATGSVPLAFPGLEVRNGGGAHAYGQLC